MIEIIRLDATSWRAVVHVDPALGLAGVSGAETREGPWIGGEGPTPERALTELYINLGRSMLTGSLHKRSDTE
jgi:hypothetical protein